MQVQALDLLGRAPSPSNHSVNIGSKHGGCVIEAKQGIIAPTFEFALADDAGSSSLVGSVDGVWKMSLHILWVMRTHVGFNFNPIGEEVFKFSEELLPGQWPKVFARPILLT